MKAWRLGICVFVVRFPVEPSAERSDTPAVADACSSIELHGLGRDPLVVVESQIHGGGSGGGSEHGFEIGDSASGKYALLKVVVRSKRGWGSTARTGRSLGA